MFWTFKEKGLSSARPSWVDGIPDTTTHDDIDYRLDPSISAAKLRGKKWAHLPLTVGRIDFVPSWGRGCQETPTYPMDASLGWVNVISVGARNVITCDSSRLPPLFGSGSLSNSLFGCVSVASQSYSLSKTWQQSFLVPTRRQ